MHQSTTALFLWHRLHFTSAEKSKKSHTTTRKKDAFLARTISQSSELFPSLPNGAKRFQVQNPTYPIVVLLFLLLYFTPSSFCRRDSFEPLGAPLRSPSCRGYHRESGHSPHGHRCEHPVVPALGVASVFQNHPHTRKGKRRGKAVIEVNKLEGLLLLVVGIRIRMATV